MHGSQIQQLHIGYTNLVKCGGKYPHFLCSFNSWAWGLSVVSQTLMVLSTEAEYSLTNLDGTIYWSRVQSHKPWWYYLLKQSTVFPVRWPDKWHCSHVSQGSAHKSCAPCSRPEDEGDTHAYQTVGTTIDSGVLYYLWNYRCANFPTQGD